MKTLLLLFCLVFTYQSAVFGQVSREAAKHYNDAVLAIKQKDVRELSPPMEKP